jgi:alginate O-acetyltransferase complex protein AlgJ
MKKYVAWIYVGVFLLIVTIPSFLGLVGFDESAENAENRKKVEFPAFTLKNTAQSSLVKKPFNFYKDIVDFVIVFDAYYKDNFGLRLKYFDLFQFIKADLLKVNPIPQKVVIGTEGWYFLGNSHSDAVAESKGIINFSAQELEALHSKVKAEQAWLEARGIKYYLTVAPNKLTIYGDKLPIVKSSKPTKLEQVRGVLSKDCNFIDLAGSLATHRNEKLSLYYKTDSHWNDYGSFLGYQSIMERIKQDFPEVELPKLEDFDTTTIGSYDDLVKMFGKKAPETSFAFKQKRPEQGLEQARQLPLPSDFVMASDWYEKRYKSNVNKLKIIVFRDSFSHALVKYIKEHFGETVFIWSYSLDKELVEREKPDIVLYEIVERHIDYLK